VIPLQFCLNQSSWHHEPLQHHKGWPSLGEYSFRRRELRTDLCVIYASPDNAPLSRNLPEEENDDDVLKDVIELVGRGQGKVIP
jgi:hypothetical protein